MRSVEYLFTSHIDVADAFARQQGWRPYGRVEWQKRRRQISRLLEQLGIVAAGETVHLVGQAREVMRILKRRRAVAVVHETPRVDPRTT